MARATENEVLGIIETTLTAVQVTPLLNSASQLVTDLLSDEGYGTETLKNIELWLAAHFVAIRDPRTIEEKYGDGQQKFGGKTGMGLDATLFGQQAMAFDTSNVLKDQSESKIDATVEVIRYE